jgi:O-antigen/teichoic acid export membrane protein
MNRKMAAWAWMKNKVSLVLPKGQFARSVAVLAGGTALGQAITVLVSPILTRLYTPEDFGVLAIYSSILGILSVGASWRYELAIPLPERDEDAVNLVALSLGIVVLMTLVVGLGTWLLENHIVHWLNAPDLRAYLWLLPIGMLLVGSYQVFNYWAVRKQAFRVIAKTRLYQGFGAALTQIVCGFLKSGPVGLITGQIVGQSAGIVILASLFRKPGFRIPQVKSVEHVAKRYVRFPKLSILPAFVNAVGLQLPIIVLNTFYGNEVTGWFSLAQKVFGIPLSIISSATSQVLFGQAANHRRSRYEMESLFWKAIRQQSLLSLPLILLIPLTPILFPLVFGYIWQESGVYAAVWLPSLIANFIASPTGGFLDILERQDLFLVREVSRLVVLGGVTAISMLLRVHPLIMLSMLSGAMVIFAFIYAGLSFYAIKRGEKE